MSKIQTYLPIFSGFYHTQWEMDDENVTDENDNPVPYDRLVIDYSGYQLATVKQICNVLDRAYPKGMIKSVEFEEIKSPREYNFTNDSANVTIDINVKMVGDYLRENEEEFDAYLKERYTNRDGFISYFFNSAEEWKKDTNGYRSFGTNAHHLGSILDFIAFNEDDEAEEFLRGQIEDQSYNFISFKELDMDEDVTDEMISSAFQENKEKIVSEAFGYNSILIHEAQSKAEMFGVSWVEVLERDTKLELLASVGIQDPYQFVYQTNL